MTTPIHGLLVLDKPSGMTSRAAVDVALRWFPPKTRVGHAGTLDPLATGVLVLCIGSATRLVEYVQCMSKTYRSCFLLGARSDTDDADGAITPVDSPPVPTLSQLEGALAAFRGMIDQVPPSYSAAHVAGRRAYALARRGVEVELQPRRVRIDAIDILDYAWPRLELEIHCGKGTYIRSLARDLGDRLGCGALVETLRRTRIGPFHAEQGLPLQGTMPEQARARLLPLEQALVELPRVNLTDDEATRLRQGQAIASIEKQSLLEDGPIALFTKDAKLVGVGQVETESGFIRPAKIMGSSMAFQESER